VTQAPSADFSMQRSSREATNIPKALADWLATQLPDDAEPTVTLHTGIDTTRLVPTSRLVSEVTSTPVVRNTLPSQHSAA